jgi:hypothetical protein
MRENVEMTTSQELHDRIVGQNLGKRFLANLDKNAAVEVVRWKDADGAWHGWTMTDLADTPLDWRPGSPPSASARATPSC